MKSFKDYTNLLNSSLISIDENKVELLISTLINAWSNKKFVFLCGNGGSAGNANHLANDLIFGASYPHDIGLSVESLAANPSVITCLANDIGYENIFSYQLKAKASKGDILICFTGSGNSPNIINALNTAKELGLITFCFIGFDGGKCKNIADNLIYSEVHDMQISEDIQTIVMHFVVQRLNQKISELTQEKIKKN